MGLAQTYKDFKRLQQIANVLFRQELGYFVNKLNLKSHLPFKKRVQVTKFVKPKDSIPKRLRLVMEELGGSFVKLGQLLSLRADLVPEDYIKEFIKLQDSVKPFSFETAKRIIESELDNPIKKVFSHFNKTPVASASVGQVYEAILKSGEKVAVKVQRPNIRKIFDVDIDLMYHLSHLLEKHMPNTKNFHPTGIVEEFEKYTRREMDYLTEGKNIEMYRKVVDEEKHVVVPKVYWDYTTSRVLTMEFMEGIKISDIKSFKKLKIKRSYLSNIIVHTFVRGVLYHNFFHADPHPGNILIMKNKNVALLDFGITGMLTPDLAEKVGSLYFGLVKSDVDRVTESFINIGFLPESINRENFKADIRATWSKYYDTTLNQVDMVGFFWDTISLGRKYGMQFPVEYVLLMKSIITTEGVIQKVDPQFNFVKVSKPLFEKYMEERSSPEYILKSVKKTLLDFKSLFVNFPGDAQKILNKMKKEEKKDIDISDDDMAEFKHEIEESTNRVTIGIVLAAVILSSALLILAGIPPLIGGLPLYSIIGFIISGILLIFLVVSFFK